jgi:hypothetical protein
LSSIQKASHEYDDAEGGAEEYEVYDEDDNYFGINKFAQPPVPLKKLLQQ